MGGIGAGGQAGCPEQHREDERERFHAPDRS
jgi:hypothetical protein